MWALYKPVVVQTSLCTYEGAPAITVVVIVYLLEVLVLASQLLCLPGGLLGIALETELSADDIGLGIAVEAQPGADGQCDVVVDPKSVRAETSTWCGSILDPYVILPILLVV